ncbi:hypothetical protein AGMMS49545_23300 [Betaproteobacteria bacterium]|nr:hypothetical protein AGMMS49545_23300 [Betaproteobacteria bacterium]GHU46766.1 hypothetical protein AGMMS50289_20890 [Betaproteobacteria bacterium]
MKNKQNGMVMLEILVSLIIFVLGFVGLLGAMTSSTKLQGENRFRSEAVNIANELFGQMSVSKTETLATNYGSGSTRFTTWVNNRVKTLPNGQATITFPAASSQGALVKLTVTWLSPNAPSGTASSQYVTTTYFP